MDNMVSRLEAGRQEGKNQVEGQRENILDAAEKLFLQNGLENTPMSQIAAAAGIARVSLYRYFPDRHTIAFELAARAMKRVVQGFDPQTEGTPAELLKAGLLRCIDSFYKLCDAYRFLGMFDHLYGSRYPSQQLADWYKNEIFALGWADVKSMSGGSSLTAAQVAMLSNCTMSFLQKMALRGDLLAGEQEVSIDEQLDSYKQMVIQYLGRTARE